MRGLFENSTNGIPIAMIRLQFAKYIVAIDSCRHKFGDQPGRFHCRCPRRLGLSSRPSSIAANPTFDGKETSFLHMILCRGGAFVVCSNQSSGLVCRLRIINKHTRFGIRRTRSERRWCRRWSLRFIVSSRRNGICSYRWQNTSEKIWIRLKMGDEECRACIWPMAIISWVKKKSRRYDVDVYCRYCRFFCVLETISMTSCKGFYYYRRLKIYLGGIWDPFIMSGLISFGF